MAGVRYRCEFDASSGMDWKIDIYDASYSGAVSTFNVTDDGFTLTYNGETDDPFAPLMGSDCRITALNEDNDFDTFVSDLIGAQEERFSVQIYRDNPYHLHWVGFILTDLVTENDAPKPTPFTITATDGLARLKDIAYNDSGSLYSGMERITTHIINCLVKIGLSGFWDTNDTFLAIGANYYEDSMHAPDGTHDCAYLTKVDHGAFQYLDDYGNTVGMDCYTVLNHCLRLFNLRLCLSRGRWYALPVNGFANDTFPFVYYYRKGGVLDSAGANVNITVDDFTRLAGGVFNWMPALNNVTATYAYKQGVNDNSLISSPYIYDTDETLGDIQGGGSEKFVFTGDVEVFFQWNESPVPVKKLVIVYKLVLNVSTYYLDSTSGTVQWLEDNTKYFRCPVKTIYTDDVPGYSDLIHEFIHFGFVTPDIPESGAGTFDFVLSHYEDWDGNPVDISGYDYDLTTVCHNFRLSLYLADGTLQNGVLKFKTTSTTDGTNPVASKVEYELPEIVMGDEPNSYSTGRLSIYNDVGAAFENSDAWSLNQSGATYDINQLRCRETIACRRTPTKRYEGTVQMETFFHPYSVFEIDSDNYMMLAGTLNAYEDTWQGSWMKVACDRANLLDGSEETQSGEDFPGGISSTITQVVPGVQYYVNFGVESLTANTPANVTLTNEYADTNYALVPQWGYTATGRIIPVSITSKAATGFTVETREDCTYEWIAVKI